MTICQTIMSMSSSLSEVASQNTIKKLEKNDWSYSHEVDNCLEAMIPDGTPAPAICYLFLVFCEISIVISNDCV